MCDTTVLHIYYTRKVNGLLANMWVQYQARVHGPQTRGVQSLGVLHRQAVVVAEPVHTIYYTRVVNGKPCTTHELNDKNQLIDTPPCGCYYTFTSRAK